MFKHHGAKPAEVQPAAAADEPEKKDSTNSPAASSENETSLKELIEKNLKWSQIIYEQNRKLNSKLLWMAVASWVKILIIILPLIAAVLFLPPLFKDLWSQYGNFFGVTSDTNNDQKTQAPNSLEALIKMLNLDPAKQEQLKAMLK